MAKVKPYKWVFRARFRRNAFSWRSQPAIKRIKEAVAEIKKFARKDKVLAAAGKLENVTLYKLSEDISDTELIAQLEDHPQVSVLQFANTKKR